MANSNVFPFPACDICEPARRLLLGIPRVPVEDLLDAPPSLVTGVSGSGKTRVAQVLTRAGRLTVDLDQFGRKSKNRWLIDPVAAAAVADCWHHGVAVCDNLGDLLALPGFRRVCLLVRECSLVLADWERKKAKGVQFFREMEDVGANLSRSLLLTVEEVARYRSSLLVHVAEGRRALARTV